MVSGKLSMLVVSEIASAHWLEASIHCLPLQGLHPPVRPSGEAVCVRQ
jgi:hypothetical protein